MLSHKVGGMIRAEFLDVLGALPIQDVPDSQGTDICVPELPGAFAFSNGQRRRGVCVDYSAALHPPIPHRISHDQ